MSIFTPKIPKFASIVFIIFITLVSLTTGLSASALDFVNPDSSGNINIYEPKTNLTVAGNQVDISSKTSKDLIAAGGNVTITGDVERNLIASAGNLNIQSKIIGASVRIAGGNINLKNTIIEEDLVVAGGTVTLSNVQVKGDTYIAGNNLNITNSTFLGSASVRYGNYTGDNLDNMVAGKLDAAQSSKLEEKNQTKNQNYNNNIWDVFWPGHLGVLYGLIILLLFLSNKKSLYRFEDIKLNSKFWIDMLVGLGVLILTPIVFVLSIIILGFTLTSSILTFAYSIFFLSIVFLPFYIAKLLINSFNIKFTIVIMSFIIWFVLIINSILTNVIPVFWIVSFVAFLINLSAFGYIVNHIIRITNQYFDPKKIETVNPAQL